MKGMKRALSIAAASLIFGLAPGSAPASRVYQWDFHAGTKTSGIGDEVAISLYNDGTRPLTMGDVWTVESLDGNGSAEYFWSEEELRVEPGSVVTWFWDQMVNRCYGICQNVREGDPAPVGRYVATATVDGQEVTTRFSIGQYFTLGFRERSAEFSVFVSTQDEIDQMTAEANADEKSLIVSGIVKKQVPYNSRWNFSMGHRTIELGEVFIEVCDGSPRYVHRHRDEWLGDRWCPWSSYVKRVGI
jgi:hypothetical protein